MLLQSVRFSTRLRNADRLLTSLAPVACQYATYVGGLLPFGSVALAGAAAIDVTLVSLNGSTCFVFLQKRTSNLLLVALAPAGPLELSARVTCGLLTFAATSLGLFLASAQCLLRTTPVSSLPVGLLLPPLSLKRDVVEAPLSAAGPAACHTCQVHRRPCLWQTLQVIATAPAACLRPAPQDAAAAPASTISCVPSAVQPSEGNTDAAPAAAGSVARQAHT